MKKIVLQGLLLFAPLGACAQPSEAETKLATLMEGTLHVIPHRSSADGVLTGCGLEFGAATRDFSTMKGGMVTVVGSFYLRPHHAATLTYMLKLTVFDGFQATVGTAPANAFIRSPSGKVPVKAVRADADAKGFALFVGAFGDVVAAAYAGIADKNQLVIGFNRKPGQQDVTVKLDLTVVDSQIRADGAVVRQRSNAAVDEFISCTTDLTKSVRERLK